mmetsp:Transcript_38966/g.121362  ORF Transcript_38966/g.121362 Transcript_38966/m.121362 type:complete len:360 (+) Transcript_38966:1-1080(+)
MGLCLEGVSNPLVPRTPKRGFKVCVCGGAGGIGQPLCMLMALDPRVWELAVYDLTITMVPAEGIGADLGHIERRCRVQAYCLETTQKPVDHLQECLGGCSLVLIPAGVPSKGRSRSDLLKINANIAKSIVEACARFCPEAVVGLIVNPLNSVVPAMARLYEKAGLDPLRICGVTTLDAVRANKFVHEQSGAPIERISVPVVGGHTGVLSGASAVPLLSQDRVAARLPQAARDGVVQRVQRANAEVADAKRGKGSATLSVAYAGARFGKAVLAGLSGAPAVEGALVRSSVFDGLDYFASRVTFGPRGAERVHPVGRVTQGEGELLKSAARILQEEIMEGLAYAESTELAGQSASPGRVPS